MTTLTPDPALATTPTRGGSVATRLTSLFGGLAAGAAGLTLLFANPVPAATTGAEVTRALSDSAVLLQLVTIGAVYAAAALLLSARVLGRHVGGDRGGVVTAAGAGVALLLVAYLGSFGAGAVVASMLLSSPGAGLGEATLLSVNVTEMVRYAPSLALVVAALAARDRLPRPVVITAALLAVLIVLPFTSWIGALLAPVWLGLSAAAVARDR